MLADRIRRCIEQAVQEAGWTTIRLRAISHSLGGQWIAVFDVRQSEKIVKAGMINLVAVRWDNDAEITMQVAERLREAIPSWLEEEKQIDTGQEERLPKI
jgi:hypothetical protein